MTIGVLGVVAYARPAMVRTYRRAFAVILTELTLMDLLPPLRTSFGLAPLFGRDVWLHWVAVLCSAVGDATSGTVS